MPYLVVKCKVCGEGIGGESFPQRMAKMRRHYTSAHRRIWKESIKRGVRKRAAAKRARGK